MMLIIFAGPPCSGKTNYLNQFNNYKLVSSDTEIQLLEASKYNQKELNKLSIIYSYQKINDYISKGENYIIYDSTNLTLNRRKTMFKGVKTKNIKVVNFISDFNIIYSNWLNRGQDIKSEMLLYLFIIFNPSQRNEGFVNVKNIIKVNNYNIKYLKKFLNDEHLSINKIIDENKELKILNIFWNKAGKDFFEEYDIKKSYLEDMEKEDKLALLYSEIKYFYIDFINKIDLSYEVDYNIFIQGFIENILIGKIKGLKLSKNKTLESFHKFIKLF